MASTLTLLDQMIAATQAWESACNVSFREVNTKNEALFRVRYEPNPDVILGPGAKGVIASAFFPNDPAWQRQFSIYPNFWSYEYRTGVMRHELGHVLGFRHEHAGTKLHFPGSAPEPLGAGVRITDYDKMSVMHYTFGPGLGSPQLELTELDKQGAAMIYGAPEMGFNVVNE